MGRQPKWGLRDLPVRAKALQGSSAARREDGSHYRHGRDVLNELRYFVEWGGTSWEWMVRYAIENFIGLEMFSKEFLEVGTRRGKMACLFGLLGAKTTGLDIKESFLPLAKEEARRWAVEDKVQFLLYDGNLDKILPDKKFDLIFTKSVLFALGKSLEPFLNSMESKLKPGGKVVFIENGRGNFLVHAMRRIRHRDWDYRKARFFTDRELQLVGNIFDISEVRKKWLPPIYLILGHKKEILP